MENTCKNCKHFSFLFERDKRFNNMPEWLTKGECNNAVVCDDYIEEPSELNKMFIEGRGSLFVGIDFGCIHFKQK